MLVQHATKEQAAWYRCDECGRCGFWRSKGFEWQFFGAEEGDGIHTCSKECRDAMGDPEKAFKKLFVWTEHADGQWPTRRHDGLLSEKAPRRSTEEDAMYSPTSSTTRESKCPACGFGFTIPSEIEPGKFGRFKCAGCGLTLEADAFQTIEYVVCVCAIEDRPKRISIKGKKAKG